MQRHPSDRPDAGTLSKQVRHEARRKEIIWKGLDMGVSKNKGIPKWMVYNGKPY